MMGLEVEFNELTKAFNLFEHLFQPILQLEQGDKIGVIEIEQNNNSKYLNRINFDLYLDKNKLYQGFSRWYYKQNRRDILNKLEILFDSYAILIKRIQYMNENYTKKFENLFINAKYVNANLINKLSILNDTYNDPQFTQDIKFICVQLSEIVFEKKIEA